MLRIHAFLLLVLALALGFGWLQDHPGEISLVWPGVLPAGSDNISLGVTTFIVIELVLIALVMVLNLVARIIGYLFAPKKG